MTDPTLTGMVGPKGLHEQTSQLRISGPFSVFLRLPPRTVNGSCKADSMSLPAANCDDLALGGMTDQTELGTNQPKPSCET